MPEASMFPTIAACCFRCRSAELFLVELLAPLSALRSRCELLRLLDFENLPRDGEVEGVESGTDQASASSLNAVSNAGGP